MKKTSETGIELTARQIRDIDEINADKVAIERTLQIALQYHSNQACALSKKEKEWWDEVAERNNLDLSTGAYQVAITGAVVRIVKVEDSNG